jgi:hypothetical protein
MFPRIVVKPSDVECVPSGNIGQDLNNEPSHFVCKTAGYVK